MFKKSIILAIAFCTANVFANTITVRAADVPNTVIESWKIATKDDGYFQILGPYDHKKFVVTVAPLHDGKPSDPLTISCNAGGMYQTHRVAPGATIECVPDFKDIISMYVEDFQNGSEGTFHYEPYNIAK